MDASVETIISDLRSAVMATSDADLARKLKVDKSTVSSWRSRGRVPERFAKMAKQNHVMTISMPEVWGELQDRAHPITLLRYTIYRAEMVRSSSIEVSLLAFRDMRPFWLIMNRAVEEIRQKASSLDIELSAAQAIIMHEDLRDPDATAKRISLEMAEDFADNSWLADWK